MKKIVVVGGGFGGLNAARQLCKLKDVQVTVIDRRNHHLFQPLLYQVAMAGLSPAEISTPIRTVLSGHKNTRVLLGNVHSVNLQKKTITADFADLNYDYLILACGSKHSYFGHDEWEEFAPGLKTLEQATEIRRRVLLAYELAERETDSEKQKVLQTFAVVGGGPTGVELAGALGEISRFTLSKDFSSIDPSHTRIILIEAGPRVLPSLAEELSARASRDLEKLGVTIWTNCRVTNITAKGVNIGEEFVSAHTVLWAAGVLPSSVNKTLNVPVDKQGRVVVENDLSLKSHPEVFVVGDQAHFEQDGQPLPGLAPVAIQQGRHVAKVIKNEMSGKPRPEFRYFDKGQLATIGRTSAVGQLGKVKFVGFIAWLMWLVVHIYYLIGFKNRLFVFLDWAWSYLTFGRGARLIVSKEWRTHVLSEDR